MWYDYVEEGSSVIQKISFTPKVGLNIDVSDHAQDRQGTRIVSNKEIVDLCLKATPKLIKDLICDNLFMDDECCLMDSSNDLNIICQVRGKDIKELTFRIITVMFKKGFRPHEDTIIYKFS